MVKTIDGAISETFIKSFVGKASGDPNKSLVNALKGNASSASITDGLRLGARTFAQSVQDINSIISFLHLSKDTLGKLDKITDKLIGIAERAADSSAGIDSRNNLNADFRNLANKFIKIVKESKIADKNFLNKDGLVQLFTTIGLDPKSSESMAALFDHFDLTKKDAYLASEYEKGSRPAPIPTGAYSYTYTTTTTSAGGTVGDGTLGAVVTSTPSGAPGVVLTGNFAGDDAADIFVSQYGSSTFNVFVGNGNGTFGGRITSTGTNVSFSAATTNFNGDSYDDLVVLSTGDTFKMLAVGDGTFSSPVTVYNGGLLGDFANLDGNGSDDAYSIYTSASGIYSIKLSNGNGTFNGSTTYSLANTSLNQIFADDFNEDGTDDIVGVQPGFVSVALNNGNGTFNSYATYATDSGTTYAKLGDFNGDGHTDIVTNHSTNTIQVLLGNGNGTFKAAVSSGTSVTGAMLTFDINGDSRDDVLIGSSNVTVLLSNDDGTFKPPTSYPGINNASLAAAEDFNGDGVKDLLESSFNTQTLGTMLTGTTTSSGSSETTQTVTLSGAKEFEKIFDPYRNIRRRPDAYLMLHDLKALKHQIKDNLKALDNAQEVVGKNLDLVRAAGFAFLDLSSQLKGSEDAAEVARRLRTMISQNAGAALSQAENLQPLAVAALLQDTEDSSK